MEVSEAGQEIEDWCASVSIMEANALVVAALRTLM